jgi:aromatic-L-amino-acid decarboxylase
MQKKDMTPDELKRYGDEFSSFISDYFRKLDSFPPLPDINPGWLKNKLPDNPPVNGEDFSGIIDEINELIIPALTHWNHPKFMAYFNSTSSAPAILAEYLSAAFNQNAMVWKTSPAATELEEKTLDWYRQIIGVSKRFTPFIYDTASVSSMHALASARESKFPNIVRNEGLAGNRNIPKLRIYISEEAHSSIEKSAITLGLGLQSIKKIATNEHFEMEISELSEAIELDKQNGIVPLAVVATVGTTSSTSIDPVREIAELCKSENIWLHVDAAYGGTAALVPELRNKVTAGWEDADSIVVNPHKWMFIPVDLSVLFTKEPQTLKAAFSLVPEYLKTEEDNLVTNYMDYGLQLGRRFRSLKLWMTIKYFGQNGLAEIIREHIKIAESFADKIDNSKYFERLAPVPFSVVSFRAVSPKLKSENELNLFNEKLMSAINDTGEIFLSHTKLKGKYTIRLVISGLRTTKEDMLKAWEIINFEYLKLLETY